MLGRVDAPGVLLSSLAVCMIHPPADGWTVEGADIHLRR
jgi:hypothetical protein